MPTLVSQLTLEWQHDDGTLERLTVDASVREAFESSGEATEHAVERGASISDHVKPNADTLSVECVVTNAPIAAPGNQADGATGAVRALQIAAGGRTVTANVVQFSTAFDRVRAVDRVLRQLREAGTLLRVYTGLRVLENVLIIRYAPERSAENGQALHFTLDLRVMRIATTQRVQAPRRVRRQQNRGPQPAQPIQPTGNSSVLYSGAIDDGSGRSGAENFMRNVVGRGG